MCSTPPFSVLAVELRGHSVQPLHVADTKHISHWSVSPIQAFLVDGLGCHPKIKIKKHIEQQTSRKLALQGPRVLVHPAQAEGISKSAPQRSPAQLILVKLEPRFLTLLAKPAHFSSGHKSPLCPSSSSSLSLAAGGPSFPSLHHTV